MAETKWRRKSGGEKVAEKAGSDLESEGGKRGEDVEMETKAGTCRWGQVAPNN